MEKKDTGKRKKKKKQKKGRKILSFLYERPMSSSTYHRRLFLSFIKFLSLSSYRLFVRRNNGHFVQFFIEHFLKKKKKRRKTEKCSSARKKLRTLVQSQKARPRIITYSSRRNTRDENSHEKTGTTMDKRRELLAKLRLPSRYQKESGQRNKKRNPEAAHRRGEGRV